MIGDGSNIKSMSYVENVAQFLYQCLELKEGVYIKNYVDKPDLKTKDIVQIVQKSLSIKQFKNSIFRLSWDYLRVYWWTCYQA